MASTNEQQAEHKAAEFRDRHSLGTRPLPSDLVALIEETTGHDVAVVKVGNDGHGMTMRDPRSGKVFIVVAATRNVMRQRSTLGHELAHVLFEDWNHPGTANSNQTHRPPQEIRADAFARHLLIPQKGLLDFLGATKPPLTTAAFSEVVRHFMVSPAIAAIALENAKLIDRVTKEHWRELSTPKLAGQFGWSDQYRALSASTNTPRSPRRLLARTIEGYREGVVSLEKLALLRAQSAEDTLRELESASITPDPVDDPTIDVSELPIFPRSSDRR
ncbi:MAG: ImmA/IrrE family metallo-endopeptidase [Flaviflexus sp.]|nr:ImmA/IrrE family metallo-endopeptidase [Flaviflexus sp.]